MNITELNQDLNDLHDELKKSDPDTKYASNKISKDIMGKMDELKEFTTPTIFVGPYLYKNIDFKQEQRFLRGGVGF